MGTEFDPNYAVHVGVALKSALDSCGMTQKDLSEKLGVSKTIINEIIKAKRGISTGLAVALEPVFGLPAKYWLGIQNDYDIAEAKKSRTLISDNGEIGSGDYSAANIAYWFINRSNKRTMYEKDVITNLKLQKLLFFAQAVSLRDKNKALFNDVIVHWEYGPVVQSVYAEYKAMERCPLQNAPAVTIDATTEKLLEKVYRTYGIYTANYLVALTHKEKSWKETVRGEIITVQSIKDSFVGM